jgi:hypothetical protein
MSRQRDLNVASGRRATWWQAALGVLEPILPQAGQRSVAEQEAALAASGAPDHAGHAAMPRSDRSEKNAGSAGAPDELHAAGATLKNAGITFDMRGLPGVGEAGSLASMAAPLGLDVAIDPQGTMPALMPDMFVAASGAGVLPVGASSVSAVGGTPGAASGGALPGGASHEGGTPDLSLVPQGQEIVFTAGPQSVTGDNTPSFSYTLPSFLDPSVSFDVQGGSSIGVSGFADGSVSAGITGGIAGTLGDYTPTYPVTINPGTPNAVQDGQVFEVDPTLVSTNDASFVLSLPALQLSTGVDLGFELGIDADFHLGFGGESADPLGNLGTAIGLPPIDADIDFKHTFSIPNSRLLIPGGSITLYNLNSNTVTLGSESDLGGLPVLSGSADTTPFIGATLDTVLLFVQELGKEFQDVRAIDFSTSLGIGKIGYRAFGLPLTASLGLSQSVTLTPSGVNVTVQDMLNGQTQSGTLGTVFTFAAPESGSGTIPLDMTYTLTLDVETSLGLEGTISLAIDGPQVSGSFLGGNFSAGPLGSFPIFSESGSLATIDTENFTQTLTGSSTVDVTYQPNPVVETLSDGINSGIEVGASGATLDITASGAIFSNSYGVEGWNQGTVTIINAGLIVAQTDGISLPAGGAVTNASSGMIRGNGNPNSIGIVQTFPTIGNLLTPVTVSNDGQIQNFQTGIYLFDGAITNASNGVISGQQYGFVSGQQNGADFSGLPGALINSGTITGSVGVDMRGGGGLYNGVTGYIGSTTGGSAIYVNYGLTLVNRGTIDGGIRTSQSPEEGGTASACSLINEAGGDILNRSGAAGITLVGATTMLQNAGIIARAVYLEGSVANTVTLVPGGQFEQGVTVFGAGAVNSLYLAAGAASTLTAFGGLYQGFNNITIAQEAAWDLQLGLGELNGVTLTGLTQADRLDLTNLNFYATDSLKFNRSTDVLTITGGGLQSHLVTTLQLTGTFTGSPGFVLGADGTGGVQITNAIGADTPGTIISGPINGVTLSGTGYYSPFLTITAKGSVAYNYYGLAHATIDGIVAPFYATITNAGTVTGQNAGISLSQGGGVIDNVAGGTITGAVFGIYVSNGGSGGFITNAGTISGSLAALASNGSPLLFTNDAGGQVIGAENGVLVRNTFARIENAGTITGTANYGITIGAGGLVNNRAGALISGSVAGILIGGQAGTVFNYGSITGATGVDLQAGGLVVNEASGTITPSAASGYGVSISGDQGTIDNFGVITRVQVTGGGYVFNSGTIESSNAAAIATSGAVMIMNQGLITASSTGILLGAGASLINSGTISAYNPAPGPVGYGVSSLGGVTIQNFGTIRGGAAGVWLGAGGTLTNVQGMTIESLTNGVGAARSTATASLSNAGFITGLTGDGIDFGNTSLGDTVTNTASGVIRGGNYGVVLDGGTNVLENAGTISGGTAVLLEGAINTLIVDAGAVFNGVVKATGAQNTVEFTANSGAVTLSGLGSDYLGFQKVDFTGAASWTVQASAAELAGITFKGVTTQDHLSLIGGGALTSALSGFGTVALSNSTAFAISSGATLTDTDFTVAAGAAISGAGVLLGAVTDNGTITASGGRLALHGAVTGAGTLAAVAGATLALTSSFKLANHVSGAGTLDIGAAITLGNAGTLTIADVAILGGDSLAATGTLAAAVIDTGLLRVTTGTLKLAGALTASGTLAAATGTELDIGAGGTISGTATGLGTLLIATETKTTLEDVTDFTIAHIKLGTSATLSGDGTLTGAINDTGTIAASGGTLLLGGSIIGTGVLQAVAGAVLELTAGGTLSEAVIGSGTLELAGAYMLAAATPKVATLDIAASGALSGDGTLASFIADAGTLEALGGTLTASGAYSGSGTLAAATGAELLLSGAGSFSGALTGAGSIKLAGASTLEAGAHISAKAITFAAATTLAAGESLTNAAGDSLTLLASAGTTVILSGPAPDLLANAGTALATGAGTAEFGVAVVNTGLVSNSGGTLRFLDAVTNSGTILASGGLLSIATTVSGTGALAIGATGTLSLLLGAAASQTVDFDAATGSLYLTHPSDFQGMVTGFGAGDIIDLRNTVETSYSFSNSVLTVKDGTTIEATLHFNGVYSSNSFSLGTDNDGGTLVKFV